MIIDPYYENEVKDFYEEQKKELAKAGIILSSDDISAAAISFQKNYAEHGMCFIEAMMTAIEEVCSYRFPENHPEEKEHFSDPEILDAITETINCDPSNIIRRVSSIVRDGNTLCVTMVNGQKGVFLVSPVITIPSKTKENLLKSEALENEAYRLYQMDWMMSHGITMKDIYEKIQEWQENPDANMEPFDDYLEENGFGEGSLWVCKEEFLNAEFQDESYMEHLLSGHQNESLWDAYCSQMGMEKGSQFDRYLFGEEFKPEISIDTDLGKIEAARLYGQEKDYPGIALVFTPNDNKDPHLDSQYLVIMEKDNDQIKTIVYAPGEDEPKFIYVNYGGSNSSILL